MKIKKINKREKDRPKRILNDEVKEKRQNVIGVISKNSNNFAFLRPFSIEDNYAVEKMTRKEKNDIAKYKKTETEIYIKGEKLKEVNSGDIVSIKNYIDGKNGNSPEAEIDFIIARGRKVVVGTLRKNKNFSFVIPDDKTFISDIFISKKNDMSARDEDKVVVEVISFGTKKPNKTEGRVVKILGNINDPDILLKSILADNEIDIEYPESALKEIENLSETLTQEEVELELENGRIDLRNLKNSNNEDLRFYTIDGEDAKDLDDAIAIDKTNGMYRAYISIADVSKYIKEYSKLDKEAFLRSNSMYLINTVISMLPKKISNGICSLNAGEDKLTYTVEVLIDHEGNFNKYYIYESINNIDKRLSYNLVEEVLNNPKKDMGDLEHNILKLELDYIDKKNIEYLKELTNILKTKRNKEGYINFELPESVIELDKEGKASNIYKAEELFSNEIIEHLMLTANEVVAKTCMEFNLPAVYRIHENPDIEKVEELNEILSRFGTSINFSKRKNKEGFPEQYVKSTEYQKVLKDLREKLEIDDKERDIEEFLEAKEKNEAIYKMLQYLLLRSMKKAKYSNKPEGHFGIASENYLHFTAPIRRYSDLFVHRILKKFLKDKGKSYKKTNDFSVYEDKAAVVSEKCSQKERKTLEIERKYTSIKKAEYMADKIGEIYRGVITNVLKSGMFIELENTVEGFIKYEDMKDYYQFLNGKAIGEKYKLEYKIGDVVEVIVSDVNIIDAEVNFKMISETNDINEKLNKEI